MCILLVEDERALREIFTEFLTLEGFSILKAETSEEAAGLIEHSPEKLSLLITDVVLPGKQNGLDIGHLIRQRQPLFPVIYITGKPDKIGLLGLKEVLLPKPFRLQKLLITVQELLEDWQHVRPAYAA